MIIKSNKRGVEFGFSSVARIIIALITIIFILLITAQIFRACGDINKVEDGAKCRLLLQGSMRLEEASLGAIRNQIIPACPVIGKEVPMKDKYPEEWGGRD